MDNDLSFMVKKVIIVALLFSVVPLIVGFFIAGPMGALAGVLGALLSGGGFYLSTIVLYRTLKEKEGGAFIPIIVNVGKALVTAFVAAFFMIRNVREGLIFLLSYILIFPAIYIYAKENEKLNPYVAPSTTENENMENDEKEEV